MSIFSKIKRVGRIAEMGVLIVQDARKGDTIKAVGGALDLVNAIQDAAKRTGGAPVAIHDGAAHVDTVKAVAVAVDDHENRVSELERLIAELTKKPNPKA